MNIQFCQFLQCHFIITCISGHCGVEAVQQYNNERVNVEFDVKLALFHFFSVTCLYQTGKLCASSLESCIKMETFLQNMSR